MSRPTDREQHTTHHHEPARKVLHARKPRLRKGRASEGAAPVTAPSIGPDERRAKIEEAAYYRAERRGFEPGYELDDWLDAERDIERAFAPSSGNEATRCGE